MRRVDIKIFLAGAVLGMNACASVGHNFDTTHVRDVMRSGESKDQIVAWFGKPDQTGTMASNKKGCVTQYIYRYAHGDFTSAATGKTLVVRFDDKSSVCEAAYLEDSTVRRSVDTTHVHDVRSGESKDEIVAWFGEPVGVTTMTPDEKGCVTQYTYKKYGGAYKPIAVLLVAFDDKGIVCDTYFNEDK